MLGLRPLGPQDVLLVQFSLHVHKSGLKLDSFHFIYTCLRQKKLFVSGSTTDRQYKKRYCLCIICLFCFVAQKKQHVHHLIRCCKIAKKKNKKKIRPTYPISRKSVTGNIQLIFLGLITIIFSSEKEQFKSIL